MALYRRRDSAFWWMNLPAPGKPRRRENTHVPVDAPSADQRAENKRQALTMCAREQATYALAAKGVGPKPSITLAEYLRWYATHVTAHHRGAIRKRSMLKRLATDLGALPLGALTRERLLEWRTARARGVSGQPRPLASPPPSFFHKVPRAPDRPIRPI